MIAFRVCDEGSNSRLKQARVEFGDAFVLRRNHRTHPHRYINVTKLRVLGKMWRKLPRARGRLSLKTTLENGQCFSFFPVVADVQDDDDISLSSAGAYEVGASPDVQLDDDRHSAKRQKIASPVAHYAGVIGSTAVALSQATDLDTVYFKSLGSDDVDENSLLEFFRLTEADVVTFDLTRLYAKWSEACPRTRVIAKLFPGMRLLRQDPVECLISFICSSNNNIPRIHGMLERLRANYGEKLCVWNGVEFFAFPTISTLAQLGESELRDLGFGYRAKFVVNTAKRLEHTHGQLLALRDSDDPTRVRAFLCEYQGVGRKVADCVQLFSLEQLEVVPVDTHVFDIARRDYDPSLSFSKSLTPKTYEDVVKAFRDRFSPFAGWGHSLLFTAELAAFKKRLPKALRDEMDAFVVERKAERKRLASESK